MKNVVYANTVNTREQLCQRMQDAANGICTTPGVFERVRASFGHRDDAWRAFRAFVAIRATSKSSLSQVFNISVMLEHYTFKLLSM
jgi:hypothetical protein